MNSLDHLSARERDCLQRYFAVLSNHLGSNFIEVWLFGSAARGDMWPDWMPMHSDIDLLIITTSRPPAELSALLVDETYPFFLEAGRQISPSMATQEDFHRPPDARLREVYERVRAEGLVVYRPTSDA